MTNHNDPTIRKIEALLELAEHPATPPAEAAAAFAAAERLMIKYAIDQSMLTRASGSQADEVIVIPRKLTGSYLSQKRILFGNIARLLGVEVIRPAGKGMSTAARNTVTVIGTRAKIELAEKLFVLLDAQMVRDSLAAPLPELMWNGATRRMEAPGGAQVVAFRSNFQKGFINEVINRLEEQVNNAKQDAADEHGPGVGLMLADEAARVAKALEEKFGKVSRGAGAKANGRGGYNAGQASGREADIGNTRIAGRLALGR